MASRKRILVIDDDRLILDIAAYFLSEAGYDVVTAGNAQAGFEIAAEGKVDLVIIDMVMPGISGWELCSMLVQHESTKHLPVLFLSGRVDIPNMFFEYFTGRGSFLSKPFKRQKLLEKVRRLLGEQEQEPGDQVKHEDQ